MTAGAAPDTGVVYTDRPVARFMVEEALKSRLALDMRGKEKALLAGNCERKTALTFLNMICQYSFLDPAVGEGVFMREYIAFIKQLHTRYQVWQPEDWVPPHLTGFEIDKTVIEKQKANPWSDAVRLQDYLLTETRPVDIIVGNPPYIRQELIDRRYKELIIHKMQQKWPDHTLNRRLDMYAYFLLKALSDLKPGGSCTFIIPNTWLDSDYGDILRRLVTHSVELVSITDSGRRHFAADVNTVIVTFRKNRPGRSVILRIDEKKQTLPVTTLRNLKLPWSGWLFRCPGWAREILTTGPFRPLEDFLRIKTGIITGNNARYYTTGGTQGEPVIKSPREVNSILWRKDQAKYRIENKNIPFRIRKAVFLWPDLRGSRHFTVWNKDNLPFEHTFYGLDPLAGDDKIWALLLNSTWVWFMVEIFGRRSLGGGAIRLVKSGLRKLPLPKIDDMTIPPGMDAFLTRPILNGKEELMQHDRQRLDHWIMSAIGLGKYLDQLYADTARLLQNRITKAERL